MEIDLEKNSAHGWRLGKLDKVLFQGLSNTRSVDTAYIRDLASLSGIQPTESALRKLIDRWLERGVVTKGRRGRRVAVQLAERIRIVNAIPIKSPAPPGPPRTVNSAPPASRPQATRDSNDHAPRCCLTALVQQLQALNSRLAILTDAWRGSRKETSGSQSPPSGKWPT